MSMQTPPLGDKVWPSIEVAPPYGTIGTCLCNQANQRNTYTVIEIIYQTIKEVEKANKQIKGGLFTKTYIYNHPFLKLVRKIISTTFVVME